MIIIAGNARIRPSIWPKRWRWVGNTLNAIACRIGCGTTRAEDVKG